MVDSPTSTPPPSEDLDSARSQKRTKTARGSTSATGEKVQEERAAPRKEPLRDTSGREPIIVDPTDPRHSDKDARHFAPLPKRASHEKGEMTSIMHRFKPDEFDGLPKNRDENPHLRNARRGDAPAKLTTEDVNFTNTEFQHAHIPSYKLFGNIAYAQETVLKRLATSKILLAAVIHGGGQRYIRRSPEKVAEIKSFIKSIAFEDDDPSGRTVEVYVPEMKNENDRNRFGQPWTFFVELDARATLLRDYLLWQEVFAIHPALSFSIHPLREEDEQPWSIIVLTGKPGAVVDTPEAKKEVLAAIKEAVWANPDFCHFAAKHVADNWHVHGEVDARVKAVSDTLDISCVTAEQTGSEQPTIAYLLTGKPVTVNGDLHRAWICFFKAPGQYWRGAYCLDIGQAVVDCKLCKDTTHCAWDCSLPKVPGWAGIQPDVIYRDPKTIGIAQAVRTGDTGANADSGSSGAPPATTAPTTQAKEIWRDARSPQRGTGRGGRGARGNGRGARGAGRGARGGPGRR